MDDEHNVIAFPGARGVMARLHDDVPAIAYVAGALRVLGEPATASEISTLLRSAGVVDPSQSDLAAVQSTLTDFSLGGTCTVEALSLFRPVRLRGAEAWAFTADFRALLSSRGLPSVLRAR